MDMLDRMHHRDSVSPISIRPLHHMITAPIHAHLEHLDHLVASHGPDGQVPPTSEHLENPRNINQKRPHDQDAQDAHRT